MKLPCCLLAATLVLAACNFIPPAQPDLTRYFVLSPPAAGEAALPGGESPAEPEGRLRLGLNAIGIADYLKNPSLAIRSGSNEVRYPSLDHWAEPIEAGVQRILRATLAASPKVASVASHPFSFESQRDYDLSVEILQCEGSIGGDHASARFSARYVISPAGQKAAPTIRKTFVAPALRWNGSDYGQLARLLSEDAAALGADIVQSLPAP